MKIALHSLIIGIGCIVIAIFFGLFIKDLITLRSLIIGIGCIVIAIFFGLLVHKYNKEIKSYLRNPIPFSILIIGIVGIVVIIIFGLYIKKVFIASLIIGYVGIIVGIFGFVIGYISHKKTSEYLREFRGYMTDPNELLKEAGKIIEEAEKSIKIAVDFFGLGSETAKEGHEIYIGSLCKMAKKENINITLIALPPVIARKKTEGEFPIKSKEPGFIEKIIAKDINIGRTMEMIGIRIRSYDSIPYILFIVDDKKALFYVEEHVKEKEESKIIGYITEDSRMLDVFTEMFERMDTDSTPYPFNETAELEELKKENEFLKGILQRGFGGHITNLNDLLKEAGKLIERAEKSINIAVDFFGIGSETAKKGHAAYIGSLCKKAQIEEMKDNITVIVLSQQKAKERIESEIPSKSRKEIDKIVKNDIRIGKGMASMGIEIRSHDSIPYHLFIIDDKKALFYLEEPVKEKEERRTVGYVTEDPRMLDVFKQIFERMYEESKPYECNEEE